MFGSFKNLVKSVTIGHFVSCALVTHCAIIKTVGSALGDQNEESRNPGCVIFNDEQGASLQRTKTYEESTLSDSL